MKYLTKILSICKITMYTILIILEVRSWIGIKKIEEGDDE